MMFAPDWRMFIAGCALIATVSLCYLLQLPTTGLPSIWLDEAWLLNSAREPTLLQGLFYRDWAQTTPPALVALLRVLQLNMELTPHQLLLVPLTFAVASLPLLWHLARRLLPPEFALIALVLYAGSPLVWTYAQVVKPYSSDLFCALLLATFTLRVLGNPTAARLASWVIGCAACFLLSYSVALLLPGAWVLLILGRRTDNQASLPPRRLIPVLFAGVAVAAFVLLVRWWLILPNTDLRSLAHFWSGGYVANAENPRWFIQHALYQYLRPFPGMETPTARLFLVLAMLLFAGTLSTLRRGLGSPAGTVALGFFIGPLATVATANLLGLFPLGEARLTLFLYPFALLVACEGLRATFSVIRLGLFRRYPAMRDARRVEASAGALSLASLTLMLVLRSDALAGTWLEYRGREDCATAMTLLGALAQPGDWVYVHASMREQTRFYAEHLAVRPDRLILGEIDWPCCVPGKVRLAPLDPGHAPALNAEISRIRQRVRSGRLWLLWSRYHMGERAKMQFTARLTAAGCREVWSSRPQGIALQRWQCQR
jgi:hypothetical protein